MAFTAPTGLDVAVVAASYISDIDGKFQKCHDAFVSIQNELPTIIPVGSSANNLALLDGLAVPNGIVGPTSFMPSFSSDLETLTINHPTFGSTVESRAVIASRSHNFSTATTYDVSAFVLTETLQRAIIGLSSSGSPVMTMFCGLSEESEDASNADLAIYEFYISENSLGVHIEGMRLLVPIIADRDGYDKLMDLEVPLQGFISQYVSPDKFRFMVPFDCEILDCYWRFGNLAAGSLISFYLLGTQESGGTVQLTGDKTTGMTVDTNITLLANDPPTQMVKGQSISLVSSPATLDDLSMVIRVRKIHQEVYYEDD